MQPHMSILLQLLFNQSLQLILHQIQKNLKLKSQLIQLLKSLLMRHLLILLTPLIQLIPLMTQILIPQLRSLQLRILQQIIQISNLSQRIQLTPQLKTHLLNQSQLLTQLLNLNHLIMIQQIQHLV